MKKIMIAVMLVACGCNTEIVKPIDKSQSIECRTAVDSIHYWSVIRDKYQDTCDYWYKEAGEYEKKHGKDLKSLLIELKGSGYGLYVPVYDSRVAMFKIDSTYNCN